MGNSMEKLRRLAIQNLGAKCIKCDECDPILLDIDHIKGDGAFQRKLRGSYTILKEIALGKNLESYQLLCVKHHRIKTRENGDHLSYLNSIDKALDNLNKGLQKKSWKERLHSEKMKTARVKGRRTREEKFKQAILDSNVPESSKQLIPSMLDPT